MTTKITANVIASGAISTASLADTSITAAKLAGTLDLTGKTVTVATATAGDNDTTVASTAFVSTAIANLADSAPATLDTLNELAAALGDDANFSTTVTNSIALKAPLASPDFTGDATFDTSTLVVDSTNNRVGVNVSSPSRAFEVNSTQQIAAVISNSSNTNVRLGFEDANSSGDNFVAVGAVGDNFVAFAGGSERLRADSSGNVGIGTNSPAYRLDVAKSDNTVVNVGITNANTGTSAQTRLRLNNSGSNFGTITHTGGSFTTSGVYRQDGTYVYGNGAGGLSLITGASQPIYFATGNTERMRIGNDGNTSIGTTSTNRKLTVTGSSTSQGTIYAYTNEVHTGTNTSAHVSIRSDNPSASGDVLHVRGDGSGNLLTIDKSGTEKLVVDSSGNVGIGVTSLTYQLEVDGIGIFKKVNNAAGLAVIGGTSDEVFIDLGDSDDSNIGSIKYNNNGDYMRFFTNNAERMRIGSAGNLSIGGTANIGVLGVKQYSQTATTFRLDSFSGSGRWFYLPNGNYGYQGSEKIYANGGRNRNFVNATGTQVGSIQINSGSTAFNTTSDYRLKDNPQPLTGSGEFIDALQPKTWTWNHSDGGTGVGFIAHEAAEAGLGLCVSGEKDEVGLDQVENEQTGEYEEQVVPKYQQVDYSNSELIANMVAELQSLRARIADLENQ